MGDEMHAILNCPRFHDVRKRLFVRIELLVPNIKELNDNDKLCYILTSEDECAVSFKICIKNGPNTYTNFIDTYRMVHTK